MLENLVKLSNQYGTREECVIAGGGNSSVKDGDFIYVKASGTTLATIKAEGFVKFYAESMVLDTNGNLQNIDGDAVFSDVLVQHPFDSSNYIDLGTINVNIKGNMKNLVITIAQDSDICSFNGNIKLNNFSRYELEALLKPKSSIPDNVASLISMLGKPGSDGQITLNYKGNI